MAKYLLEWDKTGERFYETGVDHGVLYPQKDGVYPEGVTWNGLITVNDSPSGAEPSPQYADNIKYLVLYSNEEFGGSIECFYYPDEWAQCNGEEEIAEGVTFSQQTRIPFGFSYRTLLGNDTKNTNLGYKIHLWYGCMSSPSEQSHGTVNDSPEAGTFSYEVTSTPVIVEGHKPVSSVVIDSTKVDPEKLAALEQILYGTPADNSDPDNVIAEIKPRLPLPDELIQLFAAG